MASKLSEYVVRLLDKVHGNDELNAILNACSDDDCDPYRTSAELARLQLAIEYKEKKVRTSSQLKLLRLSRFCIHVTHGPNHLGRVRFL